MKKLCHQITNGIIIAFAIILGFSFILTTIEKIIIGEIEMAILFFSLTILIIAYVIKKTSKRKQKHDNKTIR